MRIISRNRGNTLIVRDEQSTVMVDERNFMKRTVTQGQIALEFKGWEFLTPRERSLGLNHWDGMGQRADGTYDAYGSMPQEQPPFVPNGMGFQRWMHMSVFDTAWLSPADREYAEEFLRTWNGGGGDFLIVPEERMTAPWPSYDKIGQGAVAKIPATVRDLGLDPLRVAEYERETKNREGVVKALEQLAVDVASQKAEDAALEVSI